MFYTQMPLGMPIVIRAGFPICPMKETVFPYKGLAMITMVAPRSLRYPVVGTRIDGLLMFALCQRCAEERSHVPCEHVDEERAVTGIWTHLEIK